MKRASTLLLALILLTACKERFKTNTQEDTSNATTKDTVSSSVKKKTPPYGWYSESENNGIVIQNSLPRGGPYHGPTTKNFNYSNLVFFNRIVNETSSPVEVEINFSADSIAIPDSPGIFVKIFTPPDTMTWEKQSVYNFGFTRLESFDKPTSYRKTLNPNEDCLFNVVGIFYQTYPTVENQQRGGNRAELVLKGQDLFYRMPPQIDWLPCGRIVAK